ncbi:hypothetical protein SEA_BIGSWOLE_102 [Mycobacterium phage Bigswole]|uniref:ARB-07466-like C-terminal domain-containing protein n=1 Tax=Mycobacterium phage Bigswole TaxID=2041521 RepID=A0A2D1G7X0_9CAUD|nr:hypothetical protein KHO58_gp228 [Mycobacterium phage Bigswole]ATN87772.1 hypothetical protein SEA_BIGSWOLE_102 [Mycobacterium phage Bigswole]
MATKHVLHAERRDVTTRPTDKAIRRKLKHAETLGDFKMRPGYLYTVVRAISARVNQNYDGWPSDELKKAAHTFIGKPVFVNHENYDPKKARGVVVAARYVENGNDKFIEVIQEIDAKRFPKLAHEIRTGGLDSVSMGAEAGFTICSYCGNKATDVPEMCDHVLYHKGERLPRHNRKTGKVEDVLVYESCHKISFFELSYVFDPADETAVASRVLVAGRQERQPDGSWREVPNSDIPDAHYYQDQFGDIRDENNPDSGPIKQSKHIHSADCPPGQDCTVGGNPEDQITPDSANNPVNGGSNDSSSTGGGAGASAATTVSGGELGEPGESVSAGGGAGADGIMDVSRPLYDQLKTIDPNADIGGYRPGGDGYDEHNNGALDYMTTDPAVAEQVKQKAFENGAPYVIWQQQLHYPDGSTKAMEDRGSPTQNHMDHVHTGPLAGPKAARIEHTVLVTAGFVDPAVDCTVCRQARVATKCHYCAGDAEEGFSSCAAHRPMEEKKFKAASFEAKVLEAAGFRERTAAELPPPENSQHTQRPGTMGTYSKAHAYFDQAGAPYDKGTGGVLDYGAGLGHSGQFGHTYEPHPRSGFDPTYKNAEDIPEGAYHRVTNLNVLNVVPPDIRHQIVDGIGRALAPGGHAIITTRGRDVYDARDQTPVPGDDGPYGPGVVINKGKRNETYQKGFHPDELHKYVSDRLGPDFTVKKVRIGPAGVHIVRNAGKQAAMDFEARVLQAYGETEAPTRVDTLREEGSAPEDDNNDFYHYVEPPKELQTPDLSEAAQIDRQQAENQGDTMDVDGDPGPHSVMNQEPVPGAGGAPQQQFMTLQIPIPPQGQAPGVPMQSFAPPAPAPAPAPPMPPQQIAASTLDFFDRYYGRRVANWLDAIEAGREFTAEEASDYRREAMKLSTLQKAPSASTTSRNPMKGTANMARSNLASRGKVVTAGRRQHFAEGPLVDSGDQSRNDQGEQEEAFISTTPPEESVVAPTDDTPNISNTEQNLVARVKRGRAQLMADAQKLAQLQAQRQRRMANEAGGPVATEVNPTVNSGPGAEELTGDDFESANPNDGVVETQPKDASLHAFRTFDSWLKRKTGKSARYHTSATIRRAADDFSRQSNVSVQALFPALGIVLREARKNEKAAANTKGANMRKRADEKLEVAAPDGRVDVEAPTRGTTDAEAQASQFDLNDFGNNAGDDIADPDLSTDQNWAPGEAKKSSKVKTAGGVLAFRLAEAMIAAGIEPNTVERKYALAAEFENMNRGAVQDRIALCERFVPVLAAARRQVASGSTRGAALKSPIPSGLVQGAQRTAGRAVVAANDPSNDASLFI